MSEAIFGLPDNFALLLQNAIITQPEYDFLHKNINNFTIMQISKAKKIVSAINDFKADFVAKLSFVTEFSCENIINDFIQNSKLTFTENHIETIHNIINFLYDNTQKLYLLEGFAGTGKTTIITSIMQYLYDNKLIKSTVFAAPTNKAVNIIFNKYHTANNSTVFLTVHKLLKYKINYKKNGEKIFTRSKGDPFSKFDVIIIDECSMLDESIITDILGELKDNTKIIFIGDPAQLPPIGEPFSKIFNLDIKKNTMTQIVRTNQPPIIKACNDVRDWIFGVIPKLNLQKCDGNLGLYFYKNNKNIALVKNKWFGAFIKDNDGIILAWTNKQVDYYNNEIRKIKLKHNAKDKYAVEDRLIFTEFCTTGTGRFYTSDRIEIKSIVQQQLSFPKMKINIPKNPINNLAMKTINEINEKISLKYNVYCASVQKIGTEAEDTIYILQDGSLEQNLLDKELATIKIEELINCYEKFYRDDIDMIEKSVIRRLWKSFDETFNDPFAKVNYGYSTTVHKSQASSYNNVYVDVDDILNNNSDEAKRCVYTAMSRAEKKLYILL